MVIGMTTDGFDIQHQGPTITDAKLRISFTVTIPVPDIKDGLTKISWNDVPPEIVAKVRNLVVTSAALVGNAEGQPFVEISAFVPPSAHQRPR